MEAWIPAPRFSVGGKQLFKVTPRPKPSYFNAIKASDLLEPGSDRPMQLSITDTRAGGARPTIAFDIEYPLARGRILESSTLTVSDQGLVPFQFERSVFNLEEQQVRHERVHYHDRTIPLPPATYPEVLLPFLLGWTPFDGKVRSLFAWITDHFIARVRHRSLGRTRLALSSGRVEAVEVILYPDFNDWVRLGNFLSRLVSPFIPKYHMWYEAEPPHRLLRFEGPHGPPGAPEVVLELIA
jgi:hypothetical protein